MTGLSDRFFNLFSSSIGARAGCLIIAEIAQAHDGSLGMAHAYIDAVAKAGADAIKFQTHIASAESTPSEPWRVKFSRQDASRYAYWKRMEFSEEQWLGLKEHALDRGLLFLSSPFSNAAFDLLSRVGVAAWKVASGEVTNLQLLDRMLDSGLPILLSTGMSPIMEIDELVHRIKKADAPMAVLQCTSMYPTPPEKLGLNLLAYFKERYQCPVGLSDHSGSPVSGLAAVALGASVIEVHVTFDRDMFGPDVPASITFEQLTHLVEGSRFIRKALTHPVDKGQMAEDLEPMRNLFTKSIIIRNDTPAGKILTENDLDFKKPGTGLPPEAMPRVIGRKLRRSVDADHILREDDLE